MKASVINEDQIKTAGLVLTVIIVAVFMSGYFLGAKLNVPAEPYKKMTDVAAHATQDAASAAPVAKVNDSEKAKNKEDKKQIKTQNKKDSKKSDKKTDVKKATAASVAKKAQVKKTPPKKTTKKITEKKTTAVKAADKKTANKKTKAATAKPAVVETPSKPATDDKKAPVPVVRVYSIQAGMFSNEANANSFIEKLSAKTFDAYLSSFVSSSGATKYNVRVGKFAQRDQARERLREFQKSFSSPAYVVISQP